MIQHNQRFPYGVRILETGSCTFIRIENAVAYIIDNVVDFHVYGENLPTVSVPLEFADIRINAGQHHTSPTNDPTRIDIIKKS